MNWNEEQMLSWRPRPASKGLRRRIFAAETAGPAPVAKWFWGGLVPATACALMALVSLNHERDTAATRAFVTLACSNQTEIMAAGDSRSLENRLVAITFDSTNHSGFNSNMGFTPTTNFIKE
jgi:hypothetical protein